jgi:hypothetical protein
MNKDEAKNQAWVAYRRDKYPNEHNTEPHRNFDSGYEAGQRAERERIVLELDELLGDVGDGKLARFMDELRADPAESGE